MEHIYANIGILFDISIFHTELAIILQWFICLTMLHIVQFEVVIYHAYDAKVGVKIEKALFKWGDVHCWWC